MLRRWKYLSTDFVATVDPCGAQVAVRDARHHLASEQRRAGRVTELTQSLKDLQERNHFADLLEQAMTPGERRGT